MPQKRRQLFARLSEQLAEVLELDETIDVMLRAIIPQFADWMSVYLEKRDGDGFEIIAMRHWDERRHAIVQELIGTAFITEKSATARVLSTGQSLLLTQYPEDLRAVSVNSRYFEQVQQLGLRSAIVVPLKRRGRVIGAVHVIRGDNPANFDREDLRLVEELVRRLTPAIYNAEAYERERLVARHFQEAALPAALPKLRELEFDAVYEAARTEATVGGDWYDVFHVDDERLIVSVGDVAGHGLRAATMMSTLRQSVRAFSLTTASPAQLMQLLRRLVAKEYAGIYATAFVGVISPGSGRFEYTSAGHPAPLIRLADGRIEELDGARRALLGVDDDEGAPAAVTMLAEGSLLVLFTDGLTESSRDVIDGERRLRSALASAEVGNSEQPAQVIHRKLLPKGTFDDAAVLCVRYLGPRA